MPVAYFLLCYLSVAEAAAWPWLYFLHWRSRMKTQP